MGEEYSEVREALLAVFESMDFVDDVLHPAVVDAVYRLADLLGVDHDSIPTEGRALRRAAPSVEMKPRESGDLGGGNPHTE